MNRRHFVVAGFLSSLFAVVAKRAEAAPESTEKPEVCLMKLDEISAEATRFTRYEHHHQLAIPVAMLINPPDDGFKVRTSRLDQGSLDEEAFKAFLKESGLDESLRHHSHEVKFTKDELNRIASGEKDVKITVLSPKGNLAHEFFFTAPRSAIIKVKRGRSKA